MQAWLVAVVQLDADTLRQVACWKQSGRWEGVLAALMYHPSLMSQLIWTDSGEAPAGSFDRFLNVQILLVLVMQLTVSFHPHNRFVKKMWAIIRQTPKSACVDLRKAAHVIPVTLMFETLRSVQSLCKMLLNGSHNVHPHAFEENAR